MIDRASFIALFFPNLKPNLKQKNVEAEKDTANDIIKHSIEFS
jgi:hypothetical protein